MVLSNPSPFAIISPAKVLVILSVIKTELGGLCWEDEFVLLEDLKELPEFLCKTLNCSKESVKRNGGGCGGSGTICWFTQNVCCCG